MLELSHVQVFHGPIEAVHGISINVAQGQCVVLLGPNGAGKTSTLSAIAGIAQYRGAINFLGNNLVSASIEDRQRAGIALVPEGRRIFSNLSVRENLVIGAATRNNRSAVLKDIEHWFEAFPVLGERRHQMAGTLSGGEQQMLTIARALMSRPEILLLDEPSLGLAPLICQQVFRLIAELKESGMTILLVEQNVRDALELADYVYLLNTGQVTQEGDHSLFGDDTNLMAELTGIH
ncbi:ABC transporter ATP-binding protein [Chromatiales bacterium (ex Bugula neritina AB1)]|nr:ABC transporter ATP-binding protein [Chromatiales bacterium (ex Bugula neritina AB1)]